MRALYDSEAHAMYIDVVDPPHEGPNAPDREVTLTVGASLVA